MLIAREKEKKILLDALRKDESQFIAVYGRRRVGKTFLIREVYADNIVFSHTGGYKIPLKGQLESFAISLEEYGYANAPVPTSWMRAFQMLKEVIKGSNKEKKVIFLDEISWMATRNSGFLPALEQFWNSYLSARKDIVLVVCGSATSWIINHIVHNKGGLYGRLTREMKLAPFTLRQIEQFVQYKQLNFNRKQILQGYMILGGIPYYWGLMEKDLSFSANIDYLFASEGAPLRKEEEYLYKSLFENPDSYLDVIAALAKGERAGLDYSTLQNKVGTSSGGELSNRIDDLEACGFLRRYVPFGRKKRGTLIQLIDNFTLFYYKFLDPYPRDSYFFSSLIDSASWHSWSGLAFERVCLQHINQIKRALQIGGVQTEICSFHCAKDEEKGIEGSQIDLLIVRKDETINLCEMKFSSHPYEVTSLDVEAMERKKSDLRKASKTDYAIIPTLIVYPEAKMSANSSEWSSIVPGDALFGD